MYSGLSDHRIDAAGAAVLGSDGATSLYRSRKAAPVGVGGAMRPTFGESAVMAAPGRRPDNRRVRRDDDSSSSSPPRLMGRCQAWVSSPPSRLILGVHDRVSPSCPQLRHLFRHLCDTVEMGTPWGGGEPETLKDFMN